MTARPSARSSARQRLRARGHTVFTPTLEGCAERRDSLRPGIDTTTMGDEIASLLFYEDLSDVVLIVAQVHDETMTARFI